MAKKDTKTTTQEVIDSVVNDETTSKKSTVTLNDEGATTPTKTETPSNDETCPHDSANCTCEWGKCPKDTCERYWQNPTEVSTSQEFIYHLDENGKPVEVGKKANPNYKKPEDKNPEDTKKDPEPSTPSTSEPSDDKENKCDLSSATDEPWAHDTLMEDDDEHTGLEKELRFHCGVTYDVVASWLKDLKEAKDDEKDKVIDYIAWHIPTGGPQEIKVHHKEKIVEALKALK